MSTTLICNVSKHVNIPCIDQVELSGPFRWLRAGFADFAARWPGSLALGALFAAIGYLLVHEGWAQPGLAMALTVGFLLVAPFLAIGFYDLSLRRERERERGERLAAFSGVTRNLGSIGLFAFLLAFVLTVWERMSAILVGIYLGGGETSGVGLGWLFAGDNLAFLALYAGMGAVLAALVFALSVVSLPMLMDRPIDVVTACMTSLWVAWENKGVMLIWAAIIVGLTALGILTGFVGLAVIFPVLGHATWHAYRDLVER
jgi:uncharacterized membrane protein